MGQVVVAVSWKYVADVGTSGRNASPAIGLRSSRKRQAPWGPVDLWVADAEHDAVIGPPRNHVADGSLTIDVHDEWYTSERRYFWLESISKLTGPGLHPGANVILLMPLESRCIIGNSQGGGPCGRGEASSTVHPLLDDHGPRQPLAAS